MSNQKFNVPALQLQFGGLKAGYHLTRHMFKQNNPKYQADAGFDLYPVSSGHKVKDYRSGKSIINVSTLLHTFIPPGTFGLITDRSSTVETLGGAFIIEGKIDATYTGELLIRVLCDTEHSGEVLEDIKKAAKKEIPIAQLIVQPFFAIVGTEFDVTKIQGGRGSAGFGSSHIDRNTN